VLFRIGLGIAKRFALSPEKGAETIVYLASSPRGGECQWRLFRGMPSRNAE
jgi:hypothetical protein